MSCMKQIYTGCFCLKLVPPKFSKYKIPLYPLEISEQFTWGFVLGNFWGTS